MSLKLITAPDTEPTTSADLMKHLRLDDNDEVPYLEALLIRSRETIEGEILGGALVTQTWEEYLDAWPKDYFDIPLPPLQAITSITYYDSDESPTVWATTEYEVDTVSRRGRVKLATGKSWPTVTLRRMNGIVIKFVAGYGAAAVVPQSIIGVIHDLAGFWYEHRESQEYLPTDILRRLMSHRVIPI